MQGRSLERCAASNRGASVAFCFSRHSHRGSHPPPTEQGLGTVAAHTFTPFRGIRYNVVLMSTLAEALTVALTVARTAARSAIGGSHPWP